MQEKENIWIYFIYNYIFVYTYLYCIVIEQIICKMSVEHNVRIALILIFIVKPYI